MGSAPEGPNEPEETGRRRRDRDDHEPAGRDRAGEGPGYSEGISFSHGPDYSPSTSYGDGPSYAADDDETRVVGTARITVRREAPPFISEEELEGLLSDAGGKRHGQRVVLPLDDDASSFVARYLFPTERYRGEWRRHWIHIALPGLVGVLATFALGYFAGFLTRQDAGSLATIAALIWFAIIAWVGWRILDWYYDRFILTNKRVMVVNGIVTRRVAMMPLLRVTDMKYEQSPLGRILNYGTFVLESAGQEQALRTIKHLPNPNELYLRVVEEMYEPQAVEARLGAAEDEAKAEAGGNDLR